MIILLYLQSGIHLNSHSFPGTQFVTIARRISRIQDHLVTNSPDRHFISNANRSIKVHASVHSDKKGDNVRDTSTSTPAENTDDPEPSNPHQEGREPPDQAAVHRVDSEQSGRRNDGYEGNDDAEMVHNDIAKVTTNNQWIMRYENCKIVL